MARQINRRSFMKQTGVLAAASLTLTHCSKSSKKPNIIFVMADDLGYGHLGCYGQKYIKTPNIDTMAKEGLKFSQAYSGCTVCAPSRSALMTGTHTGHTSVRGNGGGASLQANDVTVAQLLQKSGYKTGLFGKWGLADEGKAGIPNKMGFDQFFGYLHQLHAQFYYPEFLWNNEKKHHLPENANFGRKTYSPDLIMEKAFEFVRQNKDNPFFLYLPTTIPHHEFIAPEEDLKEYRGKFPEVKVAHWRDNYALPEEPKATFAAMVTHLDKQVGKLFALIQELGLDDNTIIFFTSDNGGAQGPLENAEFFEANKSFRGYKRDLYEGGIRIPMIVRWPGKVQSSAETDQVTYFPDMLPTFLELAGAKSMVPADTDGLSIVPTILNTGEQKQHDFLYWEDAEYKRTGSYLEEPGTLMQAVRMGNWKGVKNNPGADIELYDLGKDIEEKNNIADKHPDVVNKIANIMKTEHRQAPPQVDLTVAEAKDLYIPKPAK